MSIKKEKDKKGTSSEVLKYAGMATTLFLMMFVMYWVGHKIDDYIGNKQPYVALVFVVVSLVAYFYKLIKDLS